MIKRITTLLLLTSSSLFANPETAPQRFAISIVAGQENATAPAAFHSSGEFLRSNRFQLTELTDVASASVGAAPLRPTLAQFRETMVRLLSNASGVHPGDQVLLNIMTHGTQANGEEEHGLVLLDGEITTSELRAYIQALEQRGATIAVLDQSCFSGSNLALASERTCVVTAAAANQPSWATFIEDFWSEAATGRSIEDTFLSARRKNLWYAQPQISTPEGAEAGRALLSLGNYLGEQQNVLPSSFLGDHPFSGECEEDQIRSVQPISDLLTQVEPILGRAFADSPEIEQLYSAIQRYAVFDQNNRPASLSRESIQRLLRQQVNIRGRRIDLFTLATSDWNLEGLEQIVASPSTPASMRRELMPQLTFARRASAARQSFIERDPEFRILAQPSIRSAELFNMTSTIFRSQTIGPPEKIIYDRIYEDSRNAHRPSQPQVCRDFHF